MSNIITNPKIEKIKIINREHWLTECVGLIAPIIEKVTEQKTPHIRVSVGFPSRGALSNKRRIIGQCWNGLASTDGTHELFIHPQLVTPIEVSATVAHEMIHAHYPKDKHQGQFPPTARAIGLTGKMTATVPGEEFIKTMEPLLAQLGTYPHAALKANGSYKVAPTLLLKVMCPVCKYTLRTTAKWLNQYGTPFCPCNGESDLIRMIQK
jgi:hypothetical protein